MRRKVLTSLLIASALITSTATFASSHKMLTSYNQLSKALQHGDQVRVTFDLNKCIAKDPDGIQRMASGLNFTNYVTYAVNIDGQHEKNATATSSTTFTEHRSFGPVYNYVRLRVFEDNSSELYSAFYDPRSYDLKSATHYICHLSDDANQSGISLHVI